MEFEKEENTPQMFDRIKIESEIPYPAEDESIQKINLNEIIFYTESLEKQLSYYVVNKENQLSKFLFDKGKLEETNHTGFIIFYVFIQEKELGNNYWLEYESAFIDGKMLKIKLLFSKTVSKIS